jgi:hypothetical protein
LSGGVCHARVQSHAPMATPATANKVNITRRP